MKLAELRTREPVDFGSLGTLSHMRAEQGYEMVLEQGTVTIQKAGVVRLMPWAACVFGIPVAVKK